MKIYVTRHGETDWSAQSKVMGKIDIELNAKGIEQAKATRDALAGTKIDLIISSPLNRALKTAEIINEALNVELVTDARISERDFGEFEGLNRNDFDFNGFCSFQKNYEYQEAENIKHFFNRVYDFLDSLNLLDSDLNILLVTHGGTSVPINCYFNGIPEDDKFAALALGNCEVTSYYFKHKKIVIDNKKS